MKIEGEFRFDATREEVWKSLLDPEVLAQVMPGCEKLEMVGDQAYEGALKIKVGPVQGKFKGKITLSDIDEPNGYSMVVDGRGAPGFVKADAQVQLTEADGGTLMSYQSEARVGGKIASVGQRLLDSSAKAIIKQSLEGLNHIVSAEVESDETSEDSAAAPEAEATESDSKSSGAATGSAASGSGGGTQQKPRPKSTYRPPTQAEFAANVAKDVIQDLVPKPVLIGAAVAAVSALFCLICCRRK